MLFLDSSPGTTLTPISTPSTTSTSTTTGDQGMDTGGDDSSEYATDCPIWAYQGYCTKSSEFMKEYCKKSCDECPSKIKKYFCQVRWEQFPKPNGLI